MTTNPIKDPRYTFETEWYDPQADIVRHYRLFFFPVNNEIAMYDKKMCRDFVKRVEYPNVKLEDLFIGAKVTIFSRVIHVVGYGDIATTRLQKVDRESTFAMIKPCSYQNVGKILTQVQKAGFQINRLKMSKFSKETAE